MSSTYTPSAVAISTVTIPSDGDGPHIKAADVNVALEALADAATFNTNSAIVPTTWSRGEALATHPVKRGFWSDKEQSWYGVAEGASDGMERSQDGGKTWVDVKAAITFSALAVQDGAVDASGNVLLVNASRNTYYGTLAGYGTLSTHANWAETSNALTAAPTTARVVRDPVANLFCVLYRVNTTGFKVDTAAVHTFTNRTIPAGWSGYTGTNNAEIGYGDGTTVAAFIDTATPHVMTSADGGANWSADATITTSALTPTIISRPTYCSRNGKWYLMLSSGAGSEVWEGNTHAEAWASVWTSTEIAHSLACDSNGVLAMVMSDGCVLYSLTGTTWKRALRTVHTTPATYSIATGGGGFMFWNSTDKTAFASTRVGDNGGTA